MHPAARLTILAVIATLALAAFTWPSANLEPRGLPVGVVGQVPPALSAGESFDVHRYASEDEARSAVTNREVYGALAGRTAFVATGASPAVPALIRDAAPGARVVDLARGTANDPRAATLGALALPLTLTGIITALLVFFTARDPRERLGLIAAAAIITGTIGALITHTWLDALPGSWLGIAGAVALAVGAIAAAVTGLASALGRPGIGVGAVLMMLVANPWSGIASAPELLPEPAGTIGQLLPTGAAASLIRGAAWFDGAGAAEPLVVLGAWLAAGVALIAAARWRGGERAPQPAAAAA